MDSYGRRQDSLMGRSENGKEPSGSIKGSKFLYQLNHCLILMNSAPQSDIKVLNIKFNQNPFSQNYSD
jgi:hypothetical protein